jgi:hypothetical protein
MPSAVSSHELDGGSPKAAGIVKSASARASVTSSDFGSGAARDKVPSCSHTSNVRVKNSLLTSSRGMGRKDGNTNRQPTERNRANYEREDAASEFYELPSMYISTSDQNEPVKVLVVGWGQQGFMEALLHELDRGDQSLPVGSEVVFMNAHSPENTVAAAVERVSINCLHLSHIQV